MTNTYSNQLEKSDNIVKRKFLFKPFECVNFSKFDEMVKTLDNYYIELNKFKTEKIKIDNDTYKKTLFSNLEKLLIEIYFFKDEKFKITKIDDVYKWFKRKVLFFQNFKEINKMTSKINFEKYPILESYKKYDVYEAQKYQTVFEKENRTDIKELTNAKERLKEFYPRKILPVKIKIADDKSYKNIKNIKSNEINFFIKANLIKDFTNVLQINRIYSENKTELENIRISSETNSKYFRSTYNTNKIYEIKNINKDQINECFDPNRKLISSNSILKPNFVNYNLVSEIKVSQSNNNEISEKRNNEEMKDFFNEWDINKAPHIEELEKKYEFKNVLNFYENSNKKEEEIKFKNKKKKNIELTNIKFFNVSINLCDNFSIFSQKNYHNDKYNKIDDKENSKIRLNFRKNKFNRFYLNDIKNLNKTCDKLKINKDLIKLNINLNEKDSVKKNILFLKDIKNNFEDVKPDKLILMKTHDKIFENKHNFKNLLGLCQVDISKDGYKYDINPLSIHDNENIHAISVAPKKLNVLRPSSGFDFINGHKKKYENKNDNKDLLLQRKTVSYSKNSNVFNREKFRKNFYSSYEAIKKVFLPPTDNTKYPKYFLPKPGFGILEKPSLINDINKTEKKNNK